MGRSSRKKRNRPWEIRVRISKLCNNGREILGYLRRHILVMLSRCPRSTIHYQTSCLISLWGWKTVSQAPETSILLKSPPDYQLFSRRNPKQNLVSIRSVSSRKIREGTIRATLKLLKMQMAIQRILILHRLSEMTKANLWKDFSTTNNCNRFQTCWTTIRSSIQISRRRRWR